MSVVLFMKRFAYDNFWAALSRSLLTHFVHIHLITSSKATFWMDSLRLVWGNPKGVTDADALRFQWPAIGRGWERGLLAFTRSRILGVDTYPGGDYALLKDVLRLPNTSVVIIAGGNDKIIPPSAVRKVAERFSPQVRYVHLEGSGHDPFEENSGEFVSVVEALLEENGSYY